MAAIPKGAIVMAGGETIGRLSREVVLCGPHHLLVAPFIAASRATVELTVEAGKATAEMRRFIRALDWGRRLEDLRHQARRKGRPGWRSIRITKAGP